MKKPRLSSAVMTGIPEDFAMEIFLRLPIRSLLRLKCVSKSWYSLISDPSFIKLHLHHFNNHPKFIGPRSYFYKPYLYDLISRESKINALPYKYIEQHHREFCGGEILCSCDGLLLIVCSYREMDQVLVWNPSTRESRELPKVHIHPYTTTNYNIGYDSSTDDYNVIRYANSFGSRDLMVFSLKKLSSWRKIKDFNYDIILKNSMNFNGALHWIQRPAASDSNAENKIVCFSFAEETIMEMELPHNDAGIVIGQKLGIWQGCLCLSETVRVRSHHHPHLNVWLMKEYGAWTKFITIPNLPLNDPSKTIPVPYNSMNKAIFIIKQVLDPMLVMYDLEKKEFEINHLHRRIKFRYLELAFVESLVSPNCRVN